MRKVTATVIGAFLRGQNMQVGNSWARDGRLYLHGNCIAERDAQGNVRVTTAGWNTNTTRDRLNGLPGVSVRMIRRTLTLNGAPWDGGWRQVTP